MCIAQVVFTFGDATPRSKHTDASRWGANTRIPCHGAPHKDSLTVKLTQGAFAVELAQGFFIMPYIKECVGLLGWYGSWW